MTDLKSFKEVWQAHRKDTPITWVLMVIVFYLATSVFISELLEKIVISVVAGTVLIVACLWLQRYS